MQWFFAYSGNSAKWFQDMIKVAVVSAKENTNLEPNCLYDGMDDELTEWLLSAGVRVHKSAVPFRDELFSDKVIQKNLSTNYIAVNASGHFLRIMAPDFSNSKYSLYTDCDVMFMGNPDFQDVDIFGACAELDSSGIPRAESFNSGVMLINNDNFLKERAGFIDYCRKNNFYCGEYSSYDQVLLNRYFKEKWVALNGRMNWRPWQGISEDAKIVHFHGPKPQRIAEILKGNHLVGEEGLLRYIEINKNSYSKYCKNFYDFLSLADI